MILYPAIELQGGRCVSLNRGRIEEPHIWHVDPIEKARAFAAAGAEWLHVTDFDGIEGDDSNTRLVRDIIVQAGIPVQYGGGFRTLQGIADWIELGAGRIVVSTLAVLQPALVRQAAHRFPDQVVVAVDIFQGRVMTHGWREPSAFSPADFIRTFDNDPLAAIIVTDIDADIGDTDASLAHVTELAGIARAPVIARGLSNTLDDLARLKYVPHISGAVIGRALYAREIELEDALNVAAASPEPIAEFI